MSAWVVPGYTEERELGHGASARVVAATRNDTGQQVAIKYLAPGLSSASQVTKELTRDEPSFDGLIVQVGGAIRDMRTSV